MALTHTLHAKGVTDAKIKVSGGTSYLDLLGIKDIKLSFVIFSEELEGDEKTLDVYSGKDGFEVDFSDMAFVNLDTLGALLGETITDEGTTPDQITSLPIGDGELPYFELVFKTDRLTNLETGDEVGAVRMTLYKCKLTSLDAVAKHKGFWTISGKARAVSDPSNNDKAGKIELKETSEEIA